MGAGNSKPQDGLSQHVFTASTPTRYSGEFVGSLQDSDKSDTTRNSNLELKIQSRVTSELERLAKEESQKLKEIADQVSKDADTPPDNSPKTLSEKLGGVITTEDPKAKLSSNSVQDEIDLLKKKLESRKKVEQADAGVEKAKDELVQCLRMNDRRPLDCWKEKEAFKREVGRLEREFVMKTVR